MVLLLAGGLSIAYGIWCHRQPVVTEQEVEQTITIPQMEPVSPFMPPPPPIVEKVVRTVRETADDSEPRLILEVTVGGIVLAESGELMRTYVGEMPSLCPT